jgi:hypothetical protein
MVSYASFNRASLCIVLLALTAGVETTRASTTTSPQAAGNSIAVGDQIVVKRKEATKEDSTKPELSKTQISPEGAEAGFESLESRLVVTGNIWWKYRFGDYVVKAVSRETSKFDRKSDVSTLERVYEVVAPTGAKAKIKRERKNFWGIEYPDASIGDLLLDAAVESAWGWSLVDDDPDPILLKYAVSSTITLTDAPGETWQLELEELPMPEGARLGSQIEWGYGTLTNGVRTLELVLRGTSPSSEEECLQMSRTWDRHYSKQCRAWVAEIKEDGELLAWDGNRSCSQNNYGFQTKFLTEYCFRVGLDENTRLLLLAMFAAMIP